MQHNHVQMSTNHIWREYKGEGDFSVEKYAIGAYLACVAYSTSSRAELERYIYMLILVLQCVTVVNDWYGSRTPLTLL